MGNDGGGAGSDQLPGMGDLPEPVAAGSARRAPNKGGRPARKTARKGARRPAVTLPVARVAVDMSLPHLDRPFDYLVSTELDEPAVPGCRVRVRFAGQLVDGFLLERVEESEHEGRLAFLERVTSPEPVLSAREGGWWDSARIGIGAPPMETPEGWLLVYHGVRQTVAGALYRAGLALLDLDDPSRVIRRCEEWVLGPSEPYELVGDVPGVVFPCGLVHVPETDELRLYYGAADTCIAMATASLSEVLAFVLEHGVQPEIDQPRHRLGAPVLHGVRHDEQSGGASIPAGGDDRPA